MEYMIETGSDSWELTERVNKRLEKNWVCQGGVVATYNAGGWKWAQALVREKISKLRHHRIIV